MGVHLKIWFLEWGGGGGHKKQINGEDCLKRGTSRVCWFKRGLGEKEVGGVYNGGVGSYRNAHYESSNFIKYSLNWIEVNESVFIA